MHEWQKMILDLIEKGLTQIEIANSMGCSQNYVSNLKNGLCGKNLGYSKGRNLRKLWIKNCSKKQAT